MTLDKKLEVELSMVYQNDTYPEDAVEKIKQAFVDEGWITPEQVKKTQELVNQMAKLANDMASMPTIQYIHLNKTQTKAEHLMTGAEWYERFSKQLEHGTIYHRNRNESIKTFEMQDVLEAARRASGIEEDK